jgi:hypothetical protein
VTIEQPARAGNNPLLHRNAMTNRIRHRLSLLAVQYSPIATPLTSKR